MDPNLEIPDNCLVSELPLDPSLETASLRVFCESPVEDGIGTPNDGARAAPNP